MSIYHDQAQALHFQLQHIAHLDSLLGHEKFEHIDQEMVTMMLEQAARFSEEKLAGLAAVADREGCVLESGAVKLPGHSAEVYQEWCELGFSTLGIPLEHEGMGFPNAVQSAIQELADGANMAFGMLGINLRCAAKALLAAASPEQLQQWLPAMISGDIATTIVISEPQAGSDVGRIRTRAEKAGQDQWLLNGSKIWISYADHDATDNILHLVLARTPEAAPGTRGLSLFAALKKENDAANGISILRLEEKMGLHGSPTCVMEFENTRAVMIGNEGEGIRNLFTMMNAMRLAVGVQGSAIANAATLHAISYARERPQGGNPDQPAVMISEHADVKRMLLEMTAQSELLRALSLRTAASLDLAEITEDADQARAHRKMAELLLPIAKTLGAEWGFQVANQGIQVLGGYGYTNDYPLERMARDIRVASIYEGTSGIQALDFVGRKLLGDNQQTMHALMDNIEQSLGDAAADNPWHQPLADILSLTRSTLTQIAGQAAAHPPSMEAGAYAMLRLCGLLVCSWNALVLWQAASADSQGQQRLRQALAHFSTGITREAESWSEKALITTITGDFRVS